jgi:hypothetical protein
MAAQYEVITYRNTLPASNNGAAPSLTITSNDHRHYGREGRNVEPLQLVNKVRPATAPDQAFDVLHYVLQTVALAHFQSCQGWS